MATNNRNNSSTNRYIEPLVDLSNNIVKNSNNQWVFIVKPDGIIFTIPAGFEDISANTSINSNSTVESEEEVHSEI
ncbi:hypothetical protein KQX54_011997 [Cotesia glomerata]|uniref:Uncharacterized protein n=1 Tax=Cotesia glomerata TaxID=32391 RepID=A0AAV7HWZ2_COTGL|nr:hypothetical protein KQX54_011997 [Cotesia glomerata]